MPQLSLLLTLNVAYADGQGWAAVLMQWLDPHSMQGDYLKVYVRMGVQWV